MWPERFTAQTFAQQPLYVVEGALLALAEIELEAAARAGDAIAQVGAAYFASMGAKDVTPLDFNGWRRVAYVRECRRRIPQAAARECLEMLRAGDLPHWAVAVITPELQALRAAAYG